MRTTHVASRDESKLSSVKLFFWENLDERQRRRECEGQLPIRIRLTFHARFRYFSPPTLQFYLLLFYIPFSLLHLHKRFYIRNIINKYQTRLISTRFVRIFPRYLQLIGSKVSSGQRREKKNRWISFRATRHLRVAPSRFHGGRHVPKWHVPRGVRACPPTRLEEVHPSRVHRSRRKAVPSLEHDGGHPRHEVSSWVHLALRVPSSSSSSSPSSSSSSGEGNSVQRTGDTNSLPLTLVAPPHFVALPPISPVPLTLT